MRLIVMAPSTASAPPESDVPVRPHPVNVQARVAVALVVLVLVLPLLGSVAVVVLPLRISGGKCQEQRRDESRDNPGPDEYLPVFFIPPRQEVICSRGGDAERSGDDCACHVVQILPERPWVEKQVCEAAQHERSVRTCRIADGMLHPGVRHDDEVPRDP